MPLIPERITQQWLKVTLFTYSRNTQNYKFSIELQYVTWASGKSSENRKSVNRIAHRLDGYFWIILEGEIKKPA